ncbi:MAG TPA: MnhB domain-containing protein [Terriglobales bacterium]|nr:MnhB domain-containing protein [Terriglobales bacterium]
MNRTRRHFLFFTSAVVLFALLWWAMRDLPPFGHYRGPYGEIINQTTVYERHITDAVTAVNFDFRGFDTLGEESILFMSVIGVTMLLRRQRGEEQEEEDDSGKNGKERKKLYQAPEASEAMKAVTLGLVGPLVVYGLYIIAHGQLTPGGGFQGGVILATAPLLVYLAGDLKTFKKIVTHYLVEIGEAAGIFGFIAIGTFGLVSGKQFLQNVLPYGTTGSVLSGGTVPLLTLTTGLAVAGGMVSAIYAFLEQTVETRMEGGNE